MFKVFTIRSMFKVLQAPSFHSTVPCTIASTSFSNMAAQYINDIPALPPLASGVDDSSAPAITLGDALSSQHVSAANLQHENRQSLANIVPALATEDEVVASKRRKHIVESSNFDGPIPAWGQQMLATQQQMQGAQQQMMETMKQMQVTQQQMHQQTQQQFQQMHQQTQQVQVTQQQMQQQFQQMLVTLQQLVRHQDQDTDRATSRSLRNATEHIVPIRRLEDGMKPNEAPFDLWFPGDQGELYTATRARVVALLNFYGLDQAGNDMEKKLRLLAYIEEGTL